MIFIFQYTTFMHWVFVSSTSKNSPMILKCLICLSKFLCNSYTCICIYAEIKYFQFVQQSLLFSFIVYGRNRIKSICFCMGTFEAFSSIMCFMMHVQCNTDVTVRLVWILVLDSLVGKAPDYRFMGLGSIPSLVHLFLFSHYNWCPANHWN